MAGRQPEQPSIKSLQVINARKDVEKREPSYTVGGNVLWQLLVHFGGFPGGSDSEESACNVGDLGLIHGLERSCGGGPGKSLQSSCLENPHGQRSLVSYSPWG